MDWAAGDAVEFFCEEGGLWVGVRVAGVKVAVAVGVCA